MQDIRELINLVEAKSKELKLEKLPYGRSSLSPVMSKNTIDYHYGELAKGYVDKFNKYLNNFTGKTTEKSNTQKLSPLVSIDLSNL